MRPCNSGNSPTMSVTRSALHSCAARAVAAGECLGGDWAFDLDRATLDRLLDDPMTLVHTVIIATRQGRDARLTRTLFAPIEQEIERRLPGAGLAWTDAIDWYFAFASPEAPIVRAGGWLAVRIALDEPIETIVPPPDVSMVKIFLADDGNMPSIPTLRPTTALATRANSRRPHRELYHAPFGRNLPSIRLTSTTGHATMSR